MNAARAIVWAVLVAAVIWAAGCAPAAKPQLPQGFVQPPASLQETPVGHIVRRDYRLREGDQIEIIYHVRHQRNDEYRIKLEDVIVIRFPFSPQLNQTEQVQSDGTLHLDLLDQPVHVFDKTIGEVQGDLLSQYSKYIKEPVLTVSFKQSNVAVAELKEAIKTAPRGQSRLVPVTPDGNISLPFVAEVRAAGLTVSELHRELNEAYRQIGLDELEVTVNLQQAMPFQVYVLGEVRIPGELLNRTGLVSSNSELTLLQAIAQSGSYIPFRADLSKVMLIRRRHLDRPQIAIVNLHQLLENRNREASGEVVADSSNYRYDLWLEDGDIIYVPTSQVAKRTDYIEYVWTRGVRAVPGFSSNASYTIGDGVDWVGPD